MCLFFHCVDTNSEKHVLSYSFELNIGKLEKKKETQTFFYNHFGVYDHFKKLRKLA